MNRGKLVRSMALRGWLPVLLLGLASVAAAASAGEGGAPSVLHVATKDSTCWSCHADWTPPLRKAVANLIPSSSSVAAAVGGSMTYGLSVQNIWKQEIRAYTMTFDISQAPALEFSSTTKPIKDARVDLTIPAVVDPAKPGAPSAEARSKSTHLNFSTPPSRSSIVFTPGDTSSTGPVLTAFIKGPDGKTDSKTASAAGGSVTLPMPFEGRSGIFEVGASVPGVQAAASATQLPQEAQVPFHFVYSADFDLSALRRLDYGVDQMGTPSADLQYPAEAPGRTHAAAPVSFTVLKAPADGEKVRVWFNTTAHYRHQNAQTVGGDWANWTQAPLTLDVVNQGAKVALEPEAGTTLLRPQIVNGPTLTAVSEVVGYAAALLLLSSILSGGMFGKASRRSMNTLFGSAKRRVAFHNVLSYGIILVAVVHMVLFLIDGDYKWTRGILFGGGSIVAMFGLGVTGAVQVPMIRRWNYATWRWTHYGMTVAVLALTVGHMLLEGAHFTDVQNALHYSDPFQKVGAAAS